MKSRFLIVLLVISFLTCYGQTTDTATCGTEPIDTSSIYYQLPWIGNNAFLDSLYYVYHDSTTLYSKAHNYCDALVNGVRFNIPVQFWIWRSDDGSA
jgi:hypothetical protein